MSGTNHSVRAFRPSVYRRAEDSDIDTQREKLAKLEIYALRAEAGLPLFETSDENPPANNPATPAVPESPALVSSSPFPVTPADNFTPAESQPADPRIDPAE